MIHSHISLLWLLENAPVDTWSSLWESMEKERIRTTLRKTIWIQLRDPRTTLKQGNTLIEQTFQRTSNQSQETYTVQLPVQMREKDSFIFLDPSQSVTTVDASLEHESQVSRLRIQIQTRSEVHVRGYVLVRKSSLEWSWIPFQLAVKHTDPPADAAKRLMHRPFVEEFTSYGVAPVVPSLVYFTNSKFRAGVFDTIFRTLSQSKPWVAELGRCLYTEWKTHREVVKQWALFHVSGTLDPSTDLWTLEIPERYCRILQSGGRVSVRCFENELWLYVGFIHKVGTDQIQVSFSGLSFTPTRVFPLLRFHLDARPYYFMGMALTKASSRLSWLWNEPERHVELLQGPPTSGKTRVLTQSIAQLVRFPENHVLVLAPTEEAADRVTTRLVEELSRVPETTAVVDRILRLPEWNRDAHSVDPTVLPYTVRDRNGYFTVDTRCTRQVWIMTPMMSRIFERLPNHSVVFTHVMVDDATRISEPELLVPLTMSCTKNISRLVLSGDVQQLGPRLFTTHTKYRLKSMFERLWKRHPDVPRREYTVSYCTPPLLMELAAEDRRYTSALDADFHRIRYRDLYEVEPDAPLVVYGVNGLAIQHINQQEIDRIQEILPAFVNQRVMVVGAYAAQTEQLRQCSGSNVRVGTLEELMDVDVDVLIVSLVDDSADMVTGFVRSPRAFYTLLTRVRGLLVVVGSPLVLQVDPHWRRLLAYAVRNQKYRGAEFHTLSFVLPDEPTRYEYERTLLPEGILNEA